MSFVKTSSLIISLLLLTFVSCSGIEKNDAENTDAYWARLVKKTEKKMSILDVLKQENPHLYQQIDSDSKDPNLVHFWGKSYNFDSGAKKQIISDAIIADLQKKFKVENDNRIVHAGITHTYGYLFSVLDTPYGYKRKRWIEPTLNYGFALSANSLAPDTLRGALLSNVTYFAGKIAFKQESDKEALDHLINVSDELKNFDYKRLQTTYLEEEISGSPVTLRTALVKLPFKRAEEENDALLIYSVWNQKEKNEVLITAFPIKKDAFNKIIDPSGLGKNQPIAVRYNAYVEGLMDQKLSGTRKIH